MNVEDNIKQRYSEGQRDINNNENSQMEEREIRAKGSAHSKPGPSKVRVGKVSKKLGFVQTYPDESDRNKKWETWWQSDSICSKRRSGNDGGSEEHLRKVSLYQ